VAWRGPLRRAAVARWPPIGRVRVAVWRGLGEDTTTGGNVFAVGPVDVARSVCCADAEVIANPDAHIRKRPARMLRMRDIDFPFLDFLDFVDRNPGFPFRAIVVSVQAQ